MHLLVPEKVAADIWLTSSFGKGFDNVIVGSLEDLETVFSFYVLIETCSDVQSLRHIPKELGLVFSDLKFLRGYQEDEFVDPNFIFAPTPLMTMDLVREKRETLYFAKNVKQGEILGIEHFGKKKGGDGVSAMFEKNLLGSKMLYDVTEGSDIYFGLME